MIVQPADGYQLGEVKARIKYALARQDSLLNDDGSVFHEADLEEDEFSDSMLPKLKRWTSDLVGIGVPAPALTNLGCLSLALSSADFRKCGL